MMFIALLTASLLVGTVGMAMSGDSIEDEPEQGNEPEDTNPNLGNSDDDFRGSFFEDEASGQDGDDLLSSYYSNDDLEGGTGDDKIAGGAEDDVIHGHEGDDELSGGSGDDKVYGGDGDDQIIGGFETDQLFGGDGNDVIFADYGDDFIVDGLGLDVVRGGEGNDNIISAEVFREDLESDDPWDVSLQNVILYDEDADEGDLINADEGDDFILAGKNDIILAGEGEDIVSTGTWVNGEVPVFADFNPAEDKIYVAIPAENGTDFATTVVDDGADAIISVGEMEVMRVLGAAGGVLSPDDVPLTRTIMTERPVDET